MELADFDVIVVGGGHAGTEAAAAAVRIGARTALVTLRREDLGALSCNPAVGGSGKGQLVRELDALGGLMGELADFACLQYRRLNAGRGAAVQATRMQVDMDQYRREARRRLEALPGLTILEDEAVAVLQACGRVRGVRLAREGELAGRTVVLALGTFCHGLIHVGSRRFPGGRLGDPGTAALPDNLAAAGFRFGRFKTGTTPRLDAHTLDYARLEEQPGDPDFNPFSSRSPQHPRLPQRSCYLTRTTPATHAIIRANLDASALYSGRITATGVRYCPSVEDKVVKFPDREHHHVFLEPEGVDGGRIYANGLSSSLPESVQAEMVASVPGLESAAILEYGYGIEHDYLDATQLDAGLEAKAVRGLFFAGQINGTTGYEEAAAQGLLAGLNAARRALGGEPVSLDRSQAYLGVLVDDLVTKGTNEPYRMFSSRVEYRLTLREDNAEFRLCPLARAWGLVDERAYAACQAREAALRAELARLGAAAVEVPRANRLLALWGEAPLSGGTTLANLLRRPGLDYDRLAQLDTASAEVPPRIREQAAIHIKYAGYLHRQERDLERFRHFERIRIPETFSYADLPGLSREIVEKLTALRPRTLGQAGRVSGVTPAALTLLWFHLGKDRATRP